jgi:outer membrane receptor protein involved in Fe transport
VTTKSGLPGALHELTATAQKSESNRRWSVTGEVLLAKTFQLAGGFNYLLSHQRFQDYDAFLAYDSKYRDSRINLFTETRYILSGNHRMKTSIQVNLDRFRQQNLITTDQDPLFVDEDRVNYNLVYDGGYEMIRNPIFEHLRLHLALSQTASRLYKPLVSPLARLSFNGGELSGFDMFLSYASTYRAPTYASLFWNEDAFSVGNPNLRPERAEIFTTGLSYIIDWGEQFKIAAEYKHRFVKDLIYWTRRFDGKYFPRNMAAALIEDLTFSWSWKLTENLGQIGVSATFTEPVDRSWEPNYHNGDLAFYPRRSVDFKYILTPGRFLFSVTSRWISDRYSRRANTKALDAYSVTDVSLGVTQKIYLFEMRMKAAVNNLFSEDYELIERYPLPRRNYAIGISLIYDFTSGGRK